MALMAECGEIEPAPDCAIFADTGWEPRKVYEHLAWLKSQLSFPVYCVSAGNIRDDILQRRNTTGGRFASVPWFTANPDGTKGMGRRQCTGEYKLKPIMHKLRELLGVDRRGYIAPGTVEVWIGISTDEALRMKPPRQRWQTGRWPLLEAKMSRSGCRDWLWREFRRVAPKSACVGCPFHDNSQWRALRDTAPDEWADAVFVDRAMRQGGSNRMRAKEFMHAQRVPLDQVDLSSKIDIPVDLFVNECTGMCGV